MIKAQKLFLFYFALENHGEYEHLSFYNIPVIYCTAIAKLDFDFKVDKLLKRVSLLERENNSNGGQKSKGSSLYALCRQQGPGIRAPLLQDDRIFGRIS